MPTATRRKTHRKEPDAYMALVRQFPLKTIKNDHEHQAAVAMLGKLIGHDLETGGRDYLDTLILIVNKYEDEHHTPHGKQLTAQQALRAIMDANGMTQADMAKIIGSESAVSMFLKGERELSKRHIKALVARFHVDATLFL